MGVCLVLCFTALGGFFSLEIWGGSVILVVMATLLIMTPHGVLRHPAGFSTSGDRVYVDARQRTLWPKLKQKYRDLRRRPGWK